MIGVFLYNVGLSSKRQLPAKSAKKILSLLLLTNGWCTSWKNDRKSS